MPDEQSPTSMIKGVLGKLAPRVKANEARGVEEEERPSFTIRRDDNEGGDVDGETKLMMLLLNKLMTIVDAKIVRQSLFYRVWLMGIY